VLPRGSLDSRGAVVRNLGYKPLVLCRGLPYIGSMVRDGRTLDHKTLEEIRRMAVERVQEGEAPSAVIASYGFCRTTIYKWLRKVGRGGRG
jgi:DNA invertase Pin-like site-specific DNA recombinase